MANCVNVTTQPMGGGGVQKNSFTIFFEHPSSQDIVKVVTCELCLKADFDDRTRTYGEFDKYR